MTCSAAQYKAFATGVAVQVQRMWLRLGHSEVRRQGERERVEEQTRREGSELGITRIRKILFKSVLFLASMNIKI